MDDQLRDGLMLGAVSFGGPFVVVAGVSFALHYFVALNAEPSKRAAWIAGLGYLGAVLIFIFVGVAGYEFLASLAAIPSGLIAFWFWRKEFRQAWVDSPDQLPDGVKLANTDWRIGLGVVAAAVVAATIKYLMRQA